MSDFTLIVYDRNYSSWSMRAGVALLRTGAAFRELNYQLSDPATRAELKRRTPSGVFPVLEHGELRIWDSLAIIEYLADCFPEAALWPEARNARAVARSVCAEMHSGFLALRQQMPMNIRARFPRSHRMPEVAAQIRRITTLWKDCRAHFGGTGPFLFGSFSAADILFAPVVMRFRSYDVRLDSKSDAYARAVEQHTAVAEWVEGARKEDYRNEIYELVED